MWILTDPLEISTVHAICSLTENVSTSEQRSLTPVTWGEYSHPPMLRVSTKRYHRLFDSSSSSTPQSSIPEGVSGSGERCPSSSSSCSGESSGELSFNGSKEGRLRPIFADKIDFRFETPVFSESFRESGISLEAGGELEQSGKCWAINDEPRGLAAETETGWTAGGRIDKSKISSGNTGLPPSHVDEGESLDH